MLAIKHQHSEQRNNKGYNGQTQRSPRALARQAGKQGSRAVPPPPTNKMDCHIAGETRLLTALRERTEGSPRVASKRYSRTRGRAGPCPPAGEARAEEQPVSAAATWADARADRPEPPAGSETWACEVPRTGEWRAAAHLGRRSVAGACVGRTRGLEKCGLPRFCSGQRQSQI